MRYSLADDRRRSSPSVTGVEYSPQFAQVAGAADVMVVGQLRRCGSTSEPTRSRVCLPFNGLLPHLAAAAAPAAGLRPRARPARPRRRPARRASSSEVPVDVAVRFRSTRLDPDALSDARRRRRRPARRTPPRRRSTWPSTTRVFAHATAGATRPPSRRAHRRHPQGELDDHRPSPTAGTATAAAIAAADRGRRACCPRSPSRSSPASRSAGDDRGRRPRSPAGRRRRRLGGAPAGSPSWSATTWSTPSPRARRRPRPGRRRAARPRRRRRRRSAGSRRGGSPAVARRDRHRAGRVLHRRHAAPAADEVHRRRPARCPTGRARAAPPRRPRPTEPLRRPLPTPPPCGPRRGIELLHGVDMEVTVELGRTRMTVRDLLGTRARRRPRARPGRRQPRRPAGQRPADRPRRGRRHRRGLRPARHRDRRRRSAAG